MTRPPAGPPPVERSLAVPPAQTERKDLQAYVKIVESFERPDRRADIRAMLGSDDLVDRFLAVAFNAIATNSDLLMNADPMTIIQAVRDSATLGLEPTGLTGEGVIIRYGQVAKFMPMYRGYLKRIRNTGKVQVIDTQVVYANDEFDYGYSEKGGWFTHHPVRPTNQSGLDAAGNPERGDYWGVYAYARFPNGYVDLDVMPAVEINAIRDRYSQSIRGEKAAESPWAVSYGEMAKKTVIRRLAKMLPQSANDELAEAVNLLLAADAAADEAKAAVEANGVGRLDTSKARRAALAAVAGRGSSPELPAVAEGVSGAVEDTGDAAAIDTTEPVQAEVEAAQAVTENVAVDDREPPLFDQEPT